MSTYVFKNELAANIAQLNPANMERFAKTVAKVNDRPDIVVNNWNVKFSPDARAKYAEHIASAIPESNHDAVLNGKRLTSLLEQTESDEANRSGRPLKVYEKVWKKTENGEDTEIQEIIDDLPMPEDIKPKKESAPVKTNDADELATAFRKLLANAVDMQQVRNLIAEALEEYTPNTSPQVSRIEISYPDKDTPTKDLGIQHKTFKKLVALAQVRIGGYAQPIWMTGPSGSGKTTAGKFLAKALGLEFYHTGAIMHKYELIGFRAANNEVAATEFRKCYEHGGVFLWDEVDASSAAALVAFNAALENGSCAFPDKTVTRHKDCIFVAAANTIGKGATFEYVGRNQIDAATLDRFIMLDWQYDENLELALASNEDWTRYVQQIRASVLSCKIKHIVSPRASIRGSALLEAGIDRDDVIDMVVRKGLSEEQWNRIINNVRSA